MFAILFNSVRNDITRRESIEHEVTSGDNSDTFSQRYFNGYIIDKYEYSKKRKEGNFKKKKSLII